MATTSFESKFGILADSTLGDKLPSIRKNSLGFQVVASEDDNERAVGVMAYRIGTRLVYVPLFWLNGRIKGGDIMYLKEEDTFRPFTEVWVNYIATGKDFKAGELDDDKNGRRGSAYRISTLNLNWLHSKRAGDVGVIDVDDVKNMARVADENDGIVDLATHLRAFSPKAAADLAAALVTSPKLANAMFAHYTPAEISGFLGNRLKEAIPAEKTASSPAVEVIYGRDDVRASTLTQAEKRDLAKNGVVVRDTRKEAAEALVVKKDATSSWAPPRVSGTYDILTDTFDTEKRTVFVHVRDAESSDDQMHGYPRPACLRNIVMFTDQPSKMMMMINNTHLPLANAAKEPGKIEIGVPVTAEALRGVVPARNTWDTSGTGPVNLDDYRKNHVLIFDDKQAVKGSVWAGDDGALVFGSAWSVETRKPIILTGKQGEIYEGDCWYIPAGAKMIALVDYKETPLACAPAAIPDTTMVNAGYVPVKVACEDKRWTIESNAGIQLDSSFPQSVETLVSFYGLRAKQAMDILGDARALKGGIVFYVKSAAETEPYAFGDDRSFTQEMSRPSGINDQAIQSIAKASEHGVKEVLDISVLKEMADSKYPIDRVTETLPTLTKALDRLCRNMFYFYWHNEEFEERYGKQSLEQLEEALKENIQALGDLVMYLQEKQSISESELLGGDKQGDLTDSMR